MLDRFNEFTLLINNIYRSIYKIKSIEIKEFALKPQHLSCLYYLFIHEKLTSKDLCDICGEDKAAISRALDYLEENEYVACDSEAKKRYKAFFYLTAKGKDIGQKINEKILMALENAGEGITNDERVLLYKILHLINDNLNEMIKKGEN